MRIFGINYKDSRPPAWAWLNTLGNPYTLNVIDGDGMLGLDLGVYGAPETFLIDGQGIVRYRHAGAVPAAALDAHPGVVLLLAVRWGCMA